MSEDLLQFTQGATNAVRYCSHCGQKAENRFCSGCGRPLQAAAAPAVVATDESVDWRNEVRFDAIMGVPSVRERVQRHSAMAKKHMTGEQFLAIADGVVSLGVSLEKIATVVQPIYASWGVKTGKRRHEEVAAPVGETIVRVLCSLAQRGQELRSADQAEDGCVLKATLPSDLLSFGGEMLITIRRTDRHTLVLAATNIAGQFMDWGKSRRKLEMLFEDVRRAA